MYKFHNDIVDILQQEQQKRIIPKFDDDENKKIDRKIKELIIDLTNVIVIYKLES
jgi:hypothetical protein